ncbi:MAG: NTP transferase domain-containing protein, partial [Croceitalea sp.]|nr:NTP transferase domain-containing protein [Croceitalea sp.]
MKNTTKLYGLVLSGGKSTRMGSDKGLLTYHGIPQRDYAYSLLNELCDSTFLSIRSEQEAEIKKEYKVIIDQDKYRGPLNGILSAHEAHPEAAWLVLACDLPLITKSSLQRLIQERDPKKAATAFATS